MAGLVAFSLQLAAFYHLRLLPIGHHSVFSMLKCLLKQVLSRALSSSCWYVRLALYHTVGGFWCTGQQFSFLERKNMNSDMFVIWHSLSHMSCVYL